MYLYLQDKEEFERELSKIEDPIVKQIAEAYTLVLKSEVQAMIRKVKPLVSEAPRDLRTFVFEILGTAYRMIGEPEMSIYYYNKAAAIAEDDFQRGRLFFLVGFLKYSLGDIWALNGVLAKFKKLTQREPSVVPWFHYLASVRAIVLGDYPKALQHAQKTKESPSIYRYALEAGGVALRGMGQFKEASRALARQAREFYQDNAAYATVPLSKILEIEAFTGRKLAPPELVEGCLKMSSKGKGLSEKAGLKYLKALVKGSPDAVLKAGDALLKSLQPYEAAAAYITAAWLAYRSESPVFFKACRAIASLSWLSRAFERDALFGRFYREVVVPVASFERGLPEKGIRAKLLGPLEIEVDGRPLDWRRWRNKKALQALVYLLVSHAHSLSAEELARMLWPDEPDGKRRLHRLQTAMSFLRRQLGNPSLVSYQDGFYTLAEVRTDFEELMAAVQRAGGNSREAKEILARHERVELLPGWEDDYIRSHRGRLREALLRLRESVQI